MGSIICMCGQEIDTTAGASMGMYQQKLTELDKDGNEEITYLVCPHGVTVINRTQSMIPLSESDRELIYG